MIESALHQLITATPAFTALAATRLYPVLLLEESPLPAATYQLISTRPLYTLDARVNLTQVRMQFDTWASTYADAKNLMTAINGSIDNLTATVGDVAILGVQLLTASDGYESDARIYRCTADYTIQYTS
jgi:hypothetical protein